MSVFFEKRQDGTKAWYYDFMYHRVRYRGIGGTTKTQALRALEKHRQEVLDDEFGLSKTLLNPRIDKFAENYLTRRKHMRSHLRDDLSVRTLLKHFKGRTLLSIRPQHIEDYISHRLRNGVSNATINRELACLKRMYNMAIKWGEARRNPVNDVDFLKEPPGRTRFLSVEESQRLLFYCADHLKPIVMTALNTGMRKMEILTLKWDQIHIDRVFEPFIELKQTKNNRKRFVPLNDDMVQLFRSMNHKSEYVFLDSRGKKPMVCVRKGFVNALERAGITDFRFHDLRHTFASHFIMNGGDPLTLKEILGHSTMKMVERYTHLASAHKLRQVNNLNRKFSICQLFASKGKTAQNTL